MRILFAVQFGCFTAAVVYLISDAMNTRLVWPGMLVGFVLNTINMYWILRDVDL